MANAKHTPGPWLQWAGSNIIIRLHSGEDRVEDLRICEVAPNTFGDAGRANARLIAAAPELLEACLVFARWAQAGQSFVYPPGSLSQVTDAILKATGSADHG